MKIEHEEVFYSMLEEILRESIGDDYVRSIVDSIFDDVKEDVETCADELYNEDDIRLAVGRVLCDRLNIER